MPIARHPGTLQLEHCDDGLHWSLELPESRSDVRQAVERGDLCAGSWQMIVGRDEWRGNVRHIHEIAELRDVAVVSNPAYQASVVEHRSTTPPRRPDTPRGRSLRVEDRAQTGGTVESRIVEAMAGVPPGEARDLTHATASPVEPDDIRNALIDALRANAVVLQAGAQLVTTDRKAVTWPILTGDVDVAFYDELDEITASDVDLDELEIPIKALKALVRGSSEAFEDSDPAPAAARRRQHQHCDGAQGRPRARRRKRRQGLQGPAQRRRHAVIDEAWAIANPKTPTSGLLEAFQTALIKRPDARLVVISTAAASMDTPLGRMRVRALAGESSNRRGAQIDARAAGLRWLEWSLPEDHALDDFRALARANPAPWIGVRELRRAGCPTDATGVRPVSRQPLGRRRGRMAAARRVESLPRPRARSRARRIRLARDRHRRRARRRRRRRRDR